MARDPNEICINCGLTYEAHGGRPLMCPARQGRPVYLSTKFEGSGCSYAVLPGTYAFPWGRVTELLDERGQTAATWYMSRLQADICAMKVDELRAELFTEKLKHADLPADAFAWIAALLKNQTPEELLPPPCDAVGSRMTRTGRKVKFLDIHIGQPFWAHKGIWIRTAYDAAARLTSTEERMGGSVCNFNIDPDDEWVEAVEVTLE